MAVEKQNSKSSFRGHEQIVTWEIDCKFKINYGIKE
jgi:hypothetical protein